MRTTSESPLASLRPFIHRLRRRFAFSAALVAATGCGTNHGSPAQPLAISTPSLAGGDVGVFYQQALSATGGSGQVRFALAAGSGLPAGLTLDPAGTISGTPSAVETASLSIDAADSAGHKASQAYSIVIAPAPALTTAALPLAEVGVAYRAAVATSGGTPPFRFELASPSVLPAGLTLDAASGAVTGTPGSASAVTVTMTATDAAGGVASRAYGLTIVAALAFDSSALPRGRVGVGYRQNLTTIGGSGPVHFEIASGSRLPGGLTLDGAAGVISGTPTIAATASFIMGASDALGGTATRTYGLVIEAAAANVPPDPSTVASPVDPTVATDIGNSTSFLYSGPDPIQTGVAPGTIEPTRAAVLRGKVIAPDGQPLPGARLTVLGHPEYGATHSRADGMFDLAVNGGGPLIVRYENDGYPSAQRTVIAPWRDFAWLPDVVMIPYDAAVTNVDLGKPALQVARGSRTSDSDGSRQATLLIPSGTSAELVLPDGSRRPLASMQVRATEYTVGAAGPSAMPAPLPPSSGYTYAVELSADEAVASGAREVRLSQPLAFYVENFLGFPVGGGVPTGYYDRENGRWIASKDGRVVKVLGVANGVADLDLDGSGAPADATALAALGVTGDERARIAQLYAAGQTLWRVPVAHFTPWDCNWPYGPPPDAAPPPSEPEPPPDIDDQNEQCGSIIGCENQTLGENIAISGTPFSLHYQSDRALGGFSLAHIRVSGPNAVSSNLLAIRLEVSIAGQVYRTSFTPGPNLEYAVPWDGKDAYGREIQGEQILSVSISYDYAPQYYSVRSAFEASFARVEAAGAGVAISRAASAVRLARTWTRKISRWRGRGMGFGGWTLNVHHLWDHQHSKQLMLGDGRQRHASAISAIITTVAGTGTAASYGDGGPATDAALNRPADLTISPNGSLYIADQGNHRVRRISPDGTISTVAGTGVAGFSGDGGPATQATLNHPSGVAIGSDGSLYIADRDNSRVRRVGADGVIATVAGSGALSFSGDGGPATAAGVPFPRHVAAAQDGSFYVNDIHRIRRVGTDGIITTVAGTGVPGFSGDGGRAIAAALNNAATFAVAPDGTLYIADVNNLRIRRVSPDGIITTVAGDGQGAHPGDGGDGNPATAAQLDDVAGISIGPDGTLYISDSDAALSRLRAIRRDGTISTFAGSRALPPQGGIPFRDGEGGPATQAHLDFNPGVTWAPDGSIYVIDFQLHCVRRVRSALPESTGVTDVIVASEDGRELYVFDAHGRHLKTLEALTGAVRYLFSYDSAGYLSSIADGSGNLTRIERSDAAPTAIVAPGGQRTILTTDADGWLASVTNPASEVHRMSYLPSGLLQTFNDPRGNTHRFTFALGRLAADEDPAGGKTTLARTELPNGYGVTTTTALNRTRIYQVERLTTGGVRRTVTQPSGLNTVTVIKSDGSEQTTSPDGLVTTVSYGPDPRWGMMAPVQTVTIENAGRLTRTIKATRAAALADSHDLLSLVRLVETVDDNGKVSARVYDAKSRSFTIATPAGRTGTVALDPLGRMAGETISGLAPVSYGYDTNGLVASVTRGVGPGSRTTTLEYDAAHQLSRMTDALGQVTRLDHDLAGRLVQQTSPDGRASQYGYDASGNLTAVTAPGRPAHSIAYNAIGAMSAHIRPDLGIGGTSTQYSYDTDGALTRTALPDGQTVDVSYDAAGRRAAVDFARGRIVHTYDEKTGKLASLAAPGGITVSYAYDGTLLSDVTWSGPFAGTVHYTYNGDWLRSSQQINGASGVTFSYDADRRIVAAGDLVLTRNADNGRLTGAAMGAISETFSYNDFGELALHIALLGTTEIYRATYSRDAAGRITRKVESNAGSAIDWGYTYDAAGRLRDVTIGGTTARIYSYDSNSNRAAVTDSSGTVTAAYDHRDRILTHGGATYSHGANGDRASKTVAGATTSYRLDALGNLTGITLADGTVIDYLIDGANRRIGKKRNSALAQGFLYDGALRLIAELNGAGGVVSRFVYATRQNVPDFMVRGGATYRIISDHLGSPRIVVDVSSGTVVQRIDYDEFGRVTADSNPGFQPFGFAGGLLDPDTGLVRFGARDYDAETGRWMAEDPILFAGGDVNLYAYSFNDPVNVQDPLGTQGGQCGGTDKPLKEKKLTDLLPDLKPDPLDDPLSHVPIKEEAEDKSLLEKGKDKSRDFVNDLKNGKRGDPPVTFEPKVKEDQRFEADMKQAGKSTATIPIIPAIPIPF